MHRITASLISTAALMWSPACSSAEPPATGVSLTVDGQKQDIRGSVTCSSHSAGDAIKIGKMPAGIYVQIEPEASGIGHLDLGNSTGTTLVGHDEKLTLVNDGTYDYDITGTAVPEDEHNASPPKPFELKIKCPRSGAGQ